MGRGPAELFIHTLTELGEGGGAPTLQYWSMVAGFTRKHSGRPIMHVCSRSGQCRTCRFPYISVCYNLFMSVIVFCLRALNIFSGPGPVRINNEDP